MRASSASRSTSTPGASVALILGSNSRVVPVAAAESSRDAAAMTESITTNLQLARGLLDAVDRGDASALAELVHASHRDHGGQVENTGLDGVRDTLRWLHETYDDMSNTPEDLIATDDRVVARVRFRATPKAAIDGVQPNGGPIDVEHIHIWRVADGQLAEHWMLRDDLGALRQLQA